MLKEWQNQWFAGVFLNLFYGFFVKKEFLASGTNQHGNTCFTYNSGDIYLIDLAKPWVTGSCLWQISFYTAPPYFY